MKVLLVDDSKLIRSMVTNMLQEMGHEVDHAEDGQVAFDKICNGLIYELILLDWNMPNVTGPELLMKLGDAKLITCPIVMMTTESAEEKIATALELGASEYVIKPFTPETLKEKIEMASGF